MSSSFASPVGDLVAAAEVKEFPVAFIGTHPGFISVASEGLGIFLLTLDAGGVNPAQSCVEITAQGGAGSVRSYFTSVKLSNTQIRVFTFDDAGNAASRPFYVSVWRIHNCGELEELTEQDWASQPEWFVDPVNGNDDNSGTTAGEALLTHEEIRRRIGDGIIDQATTIHLLGDMGSNNPVRVWFNIGEYGRLFYVGTRTNIFGPAAISAVTTINRPANQPWEIASSWTVANILNTATSVARRIRYTASATPAKVGSFAWSVKDLGGGNSRISPFISPAGVLQTPVAAPTEEIVVETLSTIVDLAIDVRVSPILHVVTGQAIVNFTDIALPTVNNIKPSARTNNANAAQTIIRFSGCEVGFMQYCNYGVLAFSGCKLGGAEVAGAQPSQVPSVILGCAVFENIAVEGGKCIMDLDTLFQDGANTASAVIVRGSGYVQFGTCGIFDHPAGTDAVEVRPGGIAESRTFLAGQTILYGAGNGGFGVRTRSCGQFVYVGTKPTINTGASETNIAGAVTAWAAVPATTAAELSAIRAQV